MNNWFTIKKLNKSLWGIAEFNHFEKVISYLLVGRERAVLIDTGMGIFDINQAVRKITELPVTVINTHCHFDHVGSNHKFAEVFFFSCDFSQNIANKGWKNSEIREYMVPQTFNVKLEGFNNETFKIKPYQHGKTLQKDEAIKIDKFNFKIIHTPGHTPDSVCILEKKLNYLFCGDTLYNGPIYLQLPESDIVDYRKSVKKLLSLKKSKFYAGHNEFEFNSGFLEKLDKKLINTNPGETRIVGKLSILL